MLSNLEVLVVYTGVAYASVLPENEGDAVIDPGLRESENKLATRENKLCVGVVVAVESHIV